jgi:anti-sigma regulatory factor (Ser/Thr protein kinase)
MVPVARLFVRAFLGSHPHAGDAELIASEYVTNALRHTASGEGGAVHVTVAAAPDGVRIEVTDHGSATRPPPGTGQAGAFPGRQGASPGSSRIGAGTWEDENGRGLMIVDSLATRWGHYGLGDGQVTAWAELGDPWEEPGCVP